MKLISRSNFPPNGWTFRQPETGWTAPTPMSDSFDQTVNKIIAHRRQNPRFNLLTDFDSVASDLEIHTCARLGNDPNWCTQGDPQKKTSWTSPPQQVFVPPKPAAVAPSVRIKRARDGVWILKEWLGQGAVPVAASLAQTRADICLTCPKNVEAGDWITLITGSVAETIRAIRNLKSEMKLSVSGEEKLKTCDACGCDLPLKVHVPIEHLNEGTSAESKAKLDPRCWQLKGT